MQSFVKFDHVSCKIQAVVDRFVPKLHPLGKFYCKLHIPNFIDIHQSDWEMKHADGQIDGNGSPLRTEATANFYGKDRLTHFKKDNNRLHAVCCHCLFSWLS
jgi:hypothetical protein